MAQTVLWTSWYSKIPPGWTPAFHTKQFCGKTRFPILEKR